MNENFVTGTSLFYEDFKVLVVLECDSSFISADWKFRFGLQLSLAIVRGVCVVKAGLDCSVPRRALAIAFDDHNALNLELRASPCDLDGIHLSGVQMPRGDGVRVVVLRPEFLREPTAILVSCREKRNSERRMLEES